MNTAAHSDSGTGPAPAADGSPPHVSPGDGPAVLEVRQASVHYGGIKAVDDLSLRLTEGKIFGILGPNGSGKNTLLAAVSRLVDLTRGSLIFDGDAYERDRPSRVPRLGIARTFQTVRLLADLTATGNVALGADLRMTRFGSISRAQKRRAADAVDRAIERVGLAGYQKLRPDEMSYGFQRRVEIARAVAQEPRLLLLDEPTAGMNRSERAEIAELLAKLRTEGLTILLVEHDVQMMVDTCDYLFAMTSGRLIAQGSPSQVVQNEAVQEAYMGKRWREHAANR